MRVIKYYGSNKKDPWYISAQVKWYLKLLKRIINPIEICILCNRDVNKVLKESKKCIFIQADSYIFCGECGNKYSLIKK